MSVVLQVALDFVDLKRALRVAQEAADGGADWLEAGTPLIKSEGLDAVRALRAQFPDKEIVADLKTMDTGRAEMEIAAKAGATIGVVMGAASDQTVRECVEAGRNYGIRICADLLGARDPANRAKEVEALGVDYVNVHCPIDDQMRGRDPFETLRKVTEQVSVPVSVAGGIYSENAADAIAAGASIVIVGGAITKSGDAKEATRLIKRALDTRDKIPASLYRRAQSENIRDILAQVSTANISDGAHRAPAITGLIPVFLEGKILGRAVTVRTCPGDWAKPVEAIDVANEGDVLVIDAGGTSPAIWGELATHSARNRKLAGVIIHGAARDTADIRAMRFPLLARLIASNAGEPKGLGEINVPIRIDGVSIRPGDWVVADADGVMILPQEQAVEMANYAMDCLEKENRIREEIEGGATTLAQVVELLRWEKR